MGREEGAGKRHSIALAPQGNLRRRREALCVRYGVAIRQRTTGTAQPRRSAADTDPASASAPPNRRTNRGISPTLAGDLRNDLQWSGRAVGPEPSNYLFFAGLSEPSNLSSEHSMMTVIDVAPSGYVVDTALVAGGILAGTSALEKKTSTSFCQKHFQT